MTYSLIVDRRLQEGEWTTERAAYDIGLTLNPRCCMSVLDEETLTAGKWSWGYNEDDPDGDRPMMVLEGRYSA